MHVTSEVALPSKCESDNDTHSFAWEPPTAARVNKIRWNSLSWPSRPCNMWRCLLLENTSLPLSSSLAFPPATLSSCRCKLSPASCLLSLSFSVLEMVFTATFPVPSLFSLFGAAVLNLHWTPLPPLRVRVNWSWLGPWEWVWFISYSRDSNVQGGLRTSAVSRHRRPDHYLKRMFPSYILSQFLIYLLQSSLPASFLICLLELTFHLPGNSGSPGVVPWLAASASLGTLSETPIPRLLPQPSRWFRYLLKLDPLRSMWAPGSQDPPVFTLHSCPAEPNVEQGLNKPSLNKEW